VPRPSVGCMTRNWINTVSLEHVQRGVEGGFTQADHGRDTRLRQLHPGDQIAFYSPRTAMRSGEPLQQFTALGTVTGDSTYQVEMGPDFHPWRLEVAFEEVTPAPIKPLLESLAFITDKKKWKIPFRRGLFEIAESDMDAIRTALLQT
jgi:hypothetical protein